jgi:hypothetical protein
MKSLLNALPLSAFVAANFFCSLSAESSPSAATAPVALEPQAVLADLYAGGFNDQFSLLRETKSVIGYEFGSKVWFLSWVGLDIGYANFGSINGAFPFEPSYGRVALPQYILQSTGTNTTHVSATAFYAAPVLRVSLNPQISGWLEVGPDRIESRVGSDLYSLRSSTSAPVFLGASGLWANVSQTRNSWAAICKLGLRYKFDSHWSLEGEFHTTGIPAFSDPQVYRNADIGRRYLTIRGEGISVVYSLGPFR